MFGLALACLTVALATVWAVQAPPAPMVYFGCVFCTPFLSMHGFPIRVQVFNIRTFMFATYFLQSSGTSTLLSSYGMRLRTISVDACFLLRSL